MPPKKQAQAGGSKKAEQKKKEKIIEVRTLPLRTGLGLAGLRSAAPGATCRRLARWAPAQVALIAPHGCSEAAAPPRSPRLHPRARRAHSAAQRPPAPSFNAQEFQRFLGLCLEKQAERHSGRPLLTDLTP